MKLWPAYLLKCTYLAALLSVFSALAFAVFYLLHDYEYLKSWFLHFDGCVYQSSGWSSRFFTPETKHAGNIFCLISLPAAAFLIAVLIREIYSEKRYSGPRLQLHRKEIPALISVAVFTAIAWLWANHTIHPFIDEYFSAVICAGDHGFRTLAYYVLPNNHVLYNFINHLFFRSTGHLLFTGRLISGAAYLCVVILLYFWHRRRGIERGLAVLLTIAVGLHFGGWAFSAMARGYSLYLLCAWVSTLSIIAYLSEQGGRWLLVFSIATIAGLCTLPSFLYLHAAHLLLMLYYTWRQAAAIKKWIRVELTIASAVLLFYLPALCFSGLQALTAAQCEAGLLSQPYANVAAACARGLPMMLGCGFSGYYGPKLTVHLIWYLVPFGLLFWRENKNYRLLLSLYIALWTSYFLLTIGLKRMPPVRAMIAHFSISYAVILLSLYLVLKVLLQRCNAQRYLRLLFGIPLVYFIVHFVRIGQTRLGDSVYSFNIAYFNLDAAPFQHAMPGTADIGFSDDSYIIYYELHEAGLAVHKCPTGDERYYIAHYDEPAPGKAYRLQDTVKGYIIYRRQ